jgi:hypothetical protein
MNMANKHKRRNKMPKQNEVSEQGIKAEELIPMPVEAKGMFLYDADGDVVCNFLWTTHRTNWKRRDEACQIVAAALNQDSSRVRALEERIEGLRTALGVCRTIICDFGQWLPSTSTNRDVKQNAIAVVDNALAADKGGA